MNLRVVLLWAVLTCLYVSVLSASDEQVVLGCLGKMPAPISKAIKEANLHADLPRAKRQASSGKTTTTPKPSPKANLPTPLYNKIDKMLKGLGVITADGVSYTNLRRLLDKNYATGQKQVEAWRKWKKCAQDASDYRREAKEETPLFIDCIVDVYKQACPN